MYSFFNCNPANYAFHLQNQIPLLVNSDRAMKRKVLHDKVQNTLSTKKNLMEKTWTLWVKLIKKYHCVFQISLFKIWWKKIRLLLNCFGFSIGVERNVKYEFRTWSTMQNDLMVSFLGKIWNWLSFFYWETIQNWFL